MLTSPNPARGTVNVAVLLIACGLSTAFGQQNYSNTIVNNTTGGPLRLMDIGSSNGIVGSLYVTGKSITFGPNQIIVKGSGYVQALPDKTVNLIALYRFQNAGETNVNYDEFGIKVNRIDWDEDGHTTAISGIDPIAITDLHGNLKITSDLLNPTLTPDGAIVLEVEKLGKVTVAFKFGNHGGRQTGIGIRGGFVGDPVLVFNKSGFVDPVPAPGKTIDAAPNLAGKADAPKPAVTTKKAIQDAQQQLQVLGYASGAADGAMGSKTVAALKKFQADHSLPVTGALDQKTLDALGVK